MNINMPSTTHCPTDLTVVGDVTPNKTHSSDLPPVAVFNDTRSIAEAVVDTLVLGDRAEWIYVKSLPCLLPKSTLSDRTVSAVARDISSVEELLDAVVETPVSNNLIDGGRYAALEHIASTFSLEALQQSLIEALEMRRYGDGDRITFLTRIGVALTS